MNHSNGIKHILLVALLLHGAPIQPYSLSDAWSSISTAISSISYKIQAMCALTVITITVLLCNKKKKPSDRNDIPIRPERQQMPPHLEEKEGLEQPGAAQNANGRSERTEKIIKAIIGGKPGNEIVSLMKNVTVDELNRQACRGKLALVCASGERNYEAMEALLKAGADVNLADVEGHTPLQELLSSYQGLDERPQLELLLNCEANWSGIHYEGLRPGLKKFLKAHITEKFDGRALIRTRANTQRRHSIEPCTELRQFAGPRCYYCWNNCLYYDVCEQCAQRLDEDEEGMHNHDYQLQATM